jgi:hypothetical protein
MQHIHFPPVPTVTPESIADGSTPELARVLLGRRAIILVQLLPHMIGMLSAEIREDEITRVYNCTRIVGLRKLDQLQAAIDTAKEALTECGADE